MELVINHKCTYLCLTSLLSFKFLVAQLEFLPISLKHLKFKMFQTQSQNMFFPLCHILCYYSKANCILTCHFIGAGLYSNQHILLTRGVLKKQAYLLLRTLKQKGSFAWFSLEKVFLFLGENHRKRHPLFCLTSQSKVQPTTATAMLLLSRKAPSG